MAGKAKLRDAPSEDPADMLADALKAALLNRDDFIITFEADDSGVRALHLMTGKLITPCMLGTLSNRCELQEGEGSRHTVLKKTRRKPAKKPKARRPE